MPELDLSLKQQKLQMKAQNVDTVVRPLLQESVKDAYTIAATTLGKVASYQQNESETRKLVQSHPYYTPIEALADCIVSGFQIDFYLERLIEECQRVSVATMRSAHDKPNSEEVNTLASYRHDLRHEIDQLVSHLHEFPPLGSEQSKLPLPSIARLAGKLWENPSPELQIQMDAVMKSIDEEKDPIQQDIFTRAVAMQYVAAGEPSLKETSKSDILYRSCVGIKQYANWQLEQWKGFICGKNTLPAINPLTSKTLATILLYQLSETPDVAPWIFYYMADSFMTAHNTQQLSTIKRHYQETYSQMYSTPYPEYTLAEHSFTLGRSQELANRISSLPHDASEELLEKLYARFNGKFHPQILSHLSAAPLEIPISDGVVKCIYMFARNSEMIDIICVGENEQQTALLIHLDNERQGWGGLPKPTTPSQKRQEETILAHYAPAIITALEREEILPKPQEIVAQPISFPTRRPTPTPPPTNLPGREERMAQHAAEAAERQVANEGDEPMEMPPTYVLDIDWGHQEPNTGLEAVMRSALTEEILLDYATRGENGFSTPDFGGELFVEEIDGIPHYTIRLPYSTR